ncbi:MULTISPECIES: hypothetical protein [unclassified Synechocystis]|nr:MULTISPECIES: hypothetical protein [unclassified Synechocystis]AIE75933.1 hypothetical protein D082_34050 [Synechocystis sp. PCC 6714]MCT0255150.1 hypothetical protein [Synechocystis sp. CS-94]
MFPLWTRPYPDNISQQNGQPQANTNGQVSFDPAIGSCHKTLAVLP